MRYIIVAAGLVLCLFPALSTAGTADEETTHLLNRVEERYTTLEQYSFTGTFSFGLEMMGMSQNYVAPFVIAGKRPGRVRMEIEHELLGSQVVSDGEATWHYIKPLNQYRKLAAVPVEPGSAGTGEGQVGDPLSTDAGNFLAFYKSFDPDEVTPRLAGRETVEIEGRGVVCAVVEMTYSQTDTTGVMGPDTLWIDPDGALVLRSAHHVALEVQGRPMKTRVVLAYEKIRADETPPDSLFVFTPPEGATLVETFGMGGPAAPDMTGEAAPDFKLADMNGKRHSLAGYRGKVVLIDFWATWCAPCRMELPYIEKLHREYRDKGLVVLAITAEPEKVAAPFVKKYGYTFPVLTDVESKVFDEYQVKSIPVVVVVDREGRITAHFVGLSAEAELRGAVRRAGIQ